MSRYRKPCFMTIHKIVYGEGDFVRNLTDVEQATLSSYEGWSIQCLPEAVYAKSKVHLSHAFQFLF